MVLTGVNSRLQLCRTAHSLGLFPRSPYILTSMPRYLHFPSSRDEKPVTATPLESVVTNRDARNPFRIRFYKNCRVVLVSLTKNFQSLTFTFQKWSNKMNHAAINSRLFNDSPVLTASPDGDCKYHTRKGRCCMPVADPLTSLCAAHSAASKSGKRPLASPPNSSPRACEKALRLIGIPRLRLGGKRAGNERGFYDDYKGVP
jgi:hypothetical protein